MLMHEPSTWLTTPGEGRARFDELVAAGRALELTSRAPDWLGGCPIAIEARTFDRFVAWDGAARRKLGVDLDEAVRLDHLFEASACAATSAGGCFVCKAVDAEGYDAGPQRHVLTMTNLGRPAQPVWLVHE